MSGSGPLSAGLERIWQSSLPRLRERLIALDKYSEALLTGTADGALQQHAKSEAHNLSGVLGTFGFPHGSVAAKHIEQGMDTTVAVGLSELKQNLKVLHEILD